MLTIIRFSTLIFALLCVASATANTDTFMAGPVIKNYGKHAKVQQDLKLDKNSVFKVAFDLGDQGSVGKVNGSIETLARFINMHVANGVPLENINLAAVVHGKAGFDLLKASLYQEKYQQKNANHDLVQALMKNHVSIFLCGQSAAYHGITNDMVMPGVQVALSAMTAHAVLQNQGYTLNPF
tara:strand:- start:138 stop:683 length:546 start_codon:yes stop_codon:yes gene_type:complete